MRLVTFLAADGAARAGALVEGDRAVVDLARAFQLTYGEVSPALGSVLSIVEGGPEALDRARDAAARASGEAVLARSAVKLRAPIQPPPQMRDCSCFETHLRQSFAAARAIQAKRNPDEALLREADAVTAKVMATFDRQPIYYKANRFAVIGADDDVIWPSYSRAMDFELEWGCYIGASAKDVPVEAAAAHVFGYTIFNDMTARDAQALEMPGQLGPAKSKDFDTGNVMGPCLVTADEIADPYDLVMIARVNGEEWGRGNTGDMRWRFADVIAHISRSETLHSGEFLGSGTVGNGCGLEQLRNLKPEDVIELEVEQIGVLRTRLVKP